MGILSYTWNYNTHDVLFRAFVTFLLHPRNLTWNLKIDPWKRRFLLRIIIFRFHVSFRGCMFYNHHHRSNLCFFLKINPGRPTVRSEPSAIEMNEAEADSVGFNERPAWNEHLKVEYVWSKVSKDVLCLFLLIPYHPCTIYTHLHYPYI